MLTTGPGPAALAPAVAAYETASITHMEQGAQMMLTAAATAAGSWQGHGGTAMMAAAVPKSEWQVEAGGHATKGAALIAEAATAHATAAMSTVPYPVVIANRIKEAALQAANVPAMGTLTPAIIESNVEYGEFWSQNATAMTSYSTAALGIISGLSVPLRPPMMTSNPAGIAAGALSMGAGLAQTGLQGAAEAMGAPAQAAGQVAATAAPTALSAATSAGNAKSGTAPQGDSAVAGAPPLAQPEGSELLSSGQSMMGVASSAPQALQGLTSPLGQVTSVPQQAMGQLSGMLGGMPGMSGGPGGGGLSAMSPGNLASSMSGVSGGYGSGGGPVSAALTKTTGGAGGPLGMPATWWGPAAAAEGSASSGQAKPSAAAARAGGPVATSGAPMGPGMYGMPPGAAAQRRDQSAARGEDDTALSVVVEDADAIPILTADGVVYTDGGG